MKERRQISRTNYISNSILVVCDTKQIMQVNTKDVSPLGMGVTLPSDSPDITGKDVILVAETLIMYADVKRQVRNADGTWHIGIQAKKFSDTVLDYLFTAIGNGAGSTALSDTESAADPQAL